MKPIYLAPLMVLSTGAFADDFWANRLGGGAEEVREQRQLQDKFKSRYRSSTVRPVAADGALIYNFKLDSEATIDIVNPDGSTAGVQPIVKDSEGNAAADATMAAAQESAADENLLTSTVRLGSGEWSVTVPRPDAAISSARRADASSNSRVGFAVVDHSSSNYALAVSLDQSATSWGSQVVITANATNNLDEIAESGRAFAGPIFRVEDAIASARVVHPDGRVSRFRLKDNGRPRSGDATAGDSVYSVKRNFRQPGDYRISLRFDARINGLPFNRTSDLHVTVDGTRVKLATRNIYATAGTVLDTPLEHGRYGLPLEVNTVTGSMSDYLNTHAEVWAKNELGKDVVVGWIGGVVQPVRTDDGTWTVPLSFHSGWLNRGTFVPPISLRNVALTDIDSGDQVLYSKGAVNVFNLDTATVNRSRAGTDQSVSTAMTMGVHPAELFGSSLRSGVVQNRTAWTRDLMFVRGWCSGLLTIGHFSQAIVNKALYDPNPAKGETADRRAIRIMDYLGWTPGRLRGIVAHSQGGLVAASLLQNYSYVFADNAQSRPPNVVSMGSPYNGSYLGDKSRSTIGRVLREAGLTSDCPTPYDIRKSQNYRWRNTIGWRAKYQIASWFTTHKKPYWYRPRACGFGSLVINGSDDGVVKPSEGLGFADGGEYDMHYSGHCHTRKIPGGSDQWRHSGFVRFVNDMFHADTEAWQPF